MAGVSEKPFRTLVRRMGASAAPTELVSAKGLIYGQARTARYLDHHPDEDPFWVQLFGAEPEVMAIGAEKAVELGAKIIDINMGCPVKKVTRTQAGSALLTDPRRAAQIVEAIAVKTGVPVTVKIRTGWDENSINTLEMVRALADAGAVLVAIHGRTRAQAYSGLADWSLIAEVARQSPIPIVGNGDIVTPTDARRCLHESGCAAVMIGRGALGNPWIFSALANDNDDLTSPDSEIRWALIRQHWIDHLEFVGDDIQALRRFRQHFIWYSHGLQCAAEFRRTITLIDQVNEALGVSEKYFCSASLAKGLYEAPECDLRSALG